MIKSLQRKFIIPALLLLFILIIFKYVLTLYYYAMDYDGWVVADWLISFKAGFVRRGLSGFFMHALSDLLGLKPNYTVMFCQMAIFLAYMFILFLLVYRKKLNIWFLTFLLSPATLLFPIYGPQSAGRKEILLFLIFGLYIIYLNTKKIKPSFAILLFSLALLLATMFHELVFFFTPYFIFAAYLKSKVDKEPFSFFKTSFVMAGSFLIMIPIYLFGRNINSSVICSELLEKGFSANICSGVLNWPADFGIAEVLKFANNADYYSSYSICLFLGLIPFVLFIKYSGQQAITLKHFLIAFLLLFLFSLPLFALAIDWGRWLNIHFMMLLFTSILLLEYTPRKVGTVWYESDLTIPYLWKSKTVSLKLLNNIVFLLLCIAYATLWHMMHYNIFSIFYTDFYSQKNPVFSLIHFIFD